MNAYVASGQNGLNLNSHLHIITTDGVHYRPEDPRFKKATKITNEKVAGLLSNIVQSITILLKNSGYLSPEGELVDNPTIDPLFHEHQSINMATLYDQSRRITHQHNYIIRPTTNNTVHETEGQL